MHFDRSDRRAARRVEARTLAHYGMRRADGLWNLSGLAASEDISLSGIRLSTPEPLPVGETVDLTFRAGDDVLSGRGHIAWVHERRAQKNYAAGLRFEGVSLDFLASLTRWKLIATGVREAFAGRELRILVCILTDGDASGLLVVDGEPGDTSYVAFQKGTVIAVRDQHGTRGLGALCSILTKPKGTLAFLPADLSGLAAEHALRVPADFDREDAASSSEEMPSAIAA